MWWIPAAASAGSNILSGIGAAEGRDAYGNVMNKAIPRLTNEYASGMNESVEGWKPYAAQGMASLSDLASWKPEQMGQFQYNKDVRSFLDPSMQFQQEQQRAAQAESAAGRGMSLSGAAAKELAQLQTNMAQTDYGNSWNRMQQDRGNIYQQFLNEFNAKNAASQARYGQLGSLVSLGTQAQGQITGAQQNVAGNRFDTGMYGAQMKAQNAAADAGFGWNTAAGLLGAGGQAVGAYNQQANFDRLFPTTTATAGTTPAVRTPYATSFNPDPIAQGQGVAALNMAGFNTSLGNQMGTPTGNLNLPQVLPPPQQYVPNYGRNFT